MKARVALFVSAVTLAGCPDLETKDQAPACVRPPSDSSSAQAEKGSSHSHAPVVARALAKLPTVVAPDPFTLEPLPRPLAPEIACANPLLPGRKLPEGASPRIRALYDACREALSHPSSSAPALVSPSARVTATSAPKSDVLANPPLLDDRAPWGLGACSVLAQTLDAGIGGPENALLATNLVARACSLDHLPSCELLAEASLRGLGAVLDPPCGEAVLRWTCDRGDATTCSELASREARGDGLAYDVADSLRLYQKACDAGSYQGCLGLSSAGSEKSKSRALQERALELAQVSCKSGVGSACSDLAWFFKPGSVDRVFPPELKAAQADATRSQYFAERACRSGQASGCSNVADTIGLLEETCKLGDFERCIDLAFEHVNGSGQGGGFSPSDRKNIATACLGGSSRGCWALGREHDDTIYQNACADGELSACRPDPRDGPTAPPGAARQGRACDQGSAIDCRELGEAAEKKGSITDALRFYELACPSVRWRADYRDVDAKGCVLAGRAYRKGERVSRDAHRAVELLMTGCYAEGRMNPRGEGCADLAEMYDAGDGVPRDADRAIDLWAGLCSAQPGHCDEMRAHQRHE